MESAHRVGPFTGVRGMETRVARIRTERLALDPIRAADAEPLFAILRSPAIGDALGETPPESEEEVRRRIESWIGGPAGSDERWLNWLARTHDGRAVAHLAATIRGSTAWLAWIVGVDSQRQGYATEAGRAIVQWLSENGV